MLSLVALGRLDDFVTFPRRDLTPESIRSQLTTGGQAVFYPPIISALIESGHAELAAAVQEKLEEGIHSQSASVIGRLKEFDRTVLGGFARRLSRNLRR
jgi:hypothetical protein